MFYKNESCEYAKAKYSTFSKKEKLLLNNFFNFFCRPSPLGDAQLEGEEEEEYI